jgi:hypothetical protein
MAVAGVWASGCDDRSTAERSASDKIASGLAEFGKIDPNTVGANPASLDSVKAQFSAAAAETGAGPAHRANAAAAIGGIDLQAAEAARLELIKTEIAARQTLGQIRASAQQVALINYFTAGYLQQNPQAAVADIDKRVKSIQGTPQSLTWAVGDGAQLPTLEALKQRTAQLEAQVAERRAQLEQLNKDRLTAVGDAETKFQSADKMKGDDAVRAFADAAESRRKSEEIAINIDLSQDQLSRLEADLTTVKDEQAALTVGIESLQSQTKAIESTWAELGQRIEAHKQHAATIANGGGETAGPPIADKAKQLADQLQTAADQRATVARLIDEADTQYNAAMTAAKELGTGIQEQATAPGVGAASWKALREAMHPNRFQLKLGAVQRLSGEVAASEAMLLSDVDGARATVSTAFDGAGLTPPQSMAAIDKKTITDAVETANERLKRALETLTNVEAGDAPKVVKNGAMISRLVTLQDLISLQSLRQTLGEPAAATDLAAYTTDAQALKATILAANLRLPRLPGELGDVPPPGTTLEAPVPEAPVPAPAEGETPATPAEPMPTEPAA